MHSIVYLCDSQYGSFKAHGSVKRPSQSIGEKKQQKFVTNPILLWATLVMTILQLRFRGGGGGESDLPLNAIFKYSAK